MPTMRGMSLRYPNPKVSSGSLAVNGNCVNEPVTIRLCTSCMIRNGKNPTNTSTTARSWRFHSRQVVKIAYPPMATAHSTASNGRVTNTTPSATPDSDQSHQDRRRTPASSAAPNSRPTEREEVAEVHPALGDEHRAGHDQRGGHEGEHVVASDLTGERVRADHREEGSPHDRRRRRAEQHVGHEHHARPTERVLREELTVGDTGQPGLEELGQAAGGAEQIARPEALHLPEVRRLVAVPREGGIDHVADDHREDARADEQQEEQPVPGDPGGRARPFRRHRRRGSGGSVRGRVEVGLDSPHWFQCTGDHSRTGVRCGGRRVVAA